MRVTLFMTTSANGMISRPDQREDFLSPSNWDAFLDHARRTGGIVWGRRTHEKVRAWNRKYLDPLRGLRNLVVSTDTGFQAGDEGFGTATSPAEALWRLSADGLDQIMLAGGALLNASFARERLIDAVVLNLEGVIVPQGIPLFAPDGIDLSLALQEVERVAPNIVQLRFDVVR